MRPVLVANGHKVYVYEHLYESISQLAENKVAGIWLPNELNRFLHKARQYRRLLSENPDVYFKRIQVWSELHALHSVEKSDLLLTM